jgi:hypothetical protein
MKGKILLVVGVGVGYVLGARAGRERYEDIKATVGKFFDNPRVQRQIDEAEGFVKDKASEGVSKIGSSVKSAVTGNRSKKRAAARPTPVKPV